MCEFLEGGDTAYAEGKLPEDDGLGLAPKL
jgi:hypothetical protein